MLKKYVLSTIFLRHQISASRNLTEIAQATLYDWEFPKSFYELDLASNGIFQCLEKKSYLHQGFQYYNMLITILKILRGCETQKTLFYQMTIHEFRNECIMEWCNTSSKGGSYIFLLPPYTLNYFRYLHLFTLFITASKSIWQNKKIYLEGSTRAEI